MEAVIKKKYEAARSNLLLVIILSAVNLLLLLFDSDISFLFSASLPQIFTVMGMYMDAVLEASFFTGVGVVLAILNLGVYLLCYFLSKKRRGWMIVAFIWFMLDWLGMILGALLIFELDFSMILELAFHIWITICLVSGLKYAKSYCEKELYTKKLSDLEIEQLHQTEE